MNALIRNIILLACLYSSYLMADTLTATQSKSDEYISISGSDCAEPPAGQMHKTLTLDCKTYHQTTTYTCGPAAVMTLMHFFKKYTDDDMNPKTELRIALEMGATDTGTTLIQMSNWLTNHGFQVEVGTRIEAATIISNLKINTPTIITVNHHWILAKGYQEASRFSPETIYFSDSCCGTTELTSRDIDALWESAELEKLHGNNCTDEGQYIVARPK